VQTSTVAAEKSPCMWSFLKIVFSCEMTYIVSGGALNSTHSLLR